MYYYDCEIWIGSLSFDIEVEFYRTPYIQGSVLDPPEGGEIIIEDYRVINVFGETYYRPAGSWEGCIKDVIGDIEDHVDIMYLRDAADEQEE